MFRACPIGCQAGEIYNLNRQDASKAVWDGLNERKSKAFWLACHTTEYLLGRILGINGLSEAN